MSNKRPNQNKRDKKPALSSSSNKSKKTPEATTRATPKSTPATSAAASDKPASQAAASSTPKAADKVTQGTASGAASKAVTAEQKPVSAGTPKLSSTAPTAPSGDGGSGGGGSNGWIAPVALFFGLIGTGFSAYLYSQLNNLRESTTVQLQNQSSQSKTSVATVQTDLDQKTSELSATIDEKTATLSATIDEKTSELANSLTSTSTELKSALDQKSTELTTALENKSSELSSELQNTTETLRGDAQKNTAEIATSTATAVQELTSKTELEINNVSTSFNTGLALIRERHSEKFGQLDQKLSDLDTSVQTTNELAMRGQRDWVLAEVNYLLRTGVHRVKLAGDMKAGVIALESASDRLHTLGDIDYLPVREQIAEEVAALRRVGPPDIEGLIFKLQHMSKRADSLPLPPSGMEKTKQALAEDPAAAGAALGQSLLDKFKGSIKIVPSEGAVTSAQRGPKIKPTKEQLTASDSLRLHLQAARLSALRHDASNFTEHMDNAIKYSSEIFDQENDLVQTYIGDLESIRETSIVPKTPMLGSSLSLFNKIDSKRGSN